MMSSGEFGSAYVWENPSGQPFIPGNAKKHLPGEKNFADGQNLVTQESTGE
jgi:hypothetical protein